MQILKSYIRPSSFFPLLIDLLLCKARLSSLLTDLFHRMFWFADSNASAYLMALVPANIAVLRTSNRLDNDHKEDHYRLMFHFESPPLAPHVVMFYRPKSETVRCLRQRMDLTIEKQIRRRRKSSGKARSKSGDRRSSLSPCPPVHEISILVEGSTVDDDSIALDQLSQSTATLVIDEKRLKIDMDPPEVLSVKLPQILCAGLPIFPIHLDLLHAARVDCRFRWFRSTKKADNPDDVELDFPFDWEPISDLGDVLLELTLNEVGFAIRLVVTPKLGTRTGIPYECVAPTAVREGPGMCPFETRHCFTPDRIENPNLLRLVSYNILAEPYCDTEDPRDSLFAACRPFAPLIEYRRPLLMKEILGYKADILCLQECDETLFHHVLSPILHDNKMIGEFCRKGGVLSEGVATFYSLSKFSSVSSKGYIMVDELESNPICSDILEAVKKSPDAHEDLKTRKNAVLLNILRRLPESNRFIIVANTHLYYRTHPVRLIQIGVILRLIEAAKHSLQKEFPGATVSVLVMGDFNSMPQFGVYKLMTGGVVESDCSDWTADSSDRHPALSKGFRLLNPFVFASACGTPEYTNFPVGFQGCLDYIFYESSQFAVEEVVPFPSHEEVTNFEALPSPTFPSDHIALVTVLETLS